MIVPHDRLRITSLHQMPTHNGVAFTADIELDSQPVGTVQNTGNGGPTNLYSPNSGFGRRMADYVAQCRFRGQAALEEQVLDCLVDEFEFSRTVAEATAAGGTVVRLLDRFRPTPAETPPHCSPRYPCASALG
jgi:hypothetical protein